ncbi:MAG: hypothetical protein VB130_08640 [Clostridium sp.]|nr:hypothetical protein [Clostridium sp.]
MKKDSKKKALRIIIGVVAVAMIVTTFASLADLNKGKNKENKENKVEVTEDTVKKDGGEKINTDITEALKKDMAAAKVKVGEKEVTSVITITGAVNKVQADRIAEEQTKALKEKYKGKDIKVQVVQKGKNDKLAETNTYGDIKNKDKGIPSMDVKIGSGITNMDRYVAVTLQTDKPEQYVVKASGQDLKYVPSKKIFHGVIQSTDEAAIKNSVKISLKK